MPELRISEKESRASFTFVNSFNHLMSFSCNQMCLVNYWFNGFICRLAFMSVRYLKTYMASTDEMRQKLEHFCLF